MRLCAGFFTEPGALRPEGRPIMLVRRGSVVVVVCGWYICELRFGWLVSEFLFGFDSEFRFGFDSEFLFGVGVGRLMREAGAGLAATGVAAAARR